MPANRGGNTMMGGEVKRGVVTPVDASDQKEGERLTVRSNIRQLRNS